MAQLDTADPNIRIMLVLFRPNLSDRYLGICLVIKLYYQGGGAAHTA